MRNSQVSRKVSSKLSSNPQSMPHGLQQQKQKNNQNQISPQQRRSPSISFTRQERFKLHSIYWPQKSDDPCLSRNSIIRLKKQRSEVDQIARKISKQIDEQQKNQQRITKIRKKSKSLLFNTTTPATNRTAGSGFVNSNPSQSFRINSNSPVTKQNRKNLGLSQRNIDILKRIFDQAPKQSLLRDRHGNRSNLFNDSELNKDLTLKVSDEVQKLGLQTLNNSFLPNKSSRFWTTTSKRKNFNLPDNYYPGPGNYDIKRYLDDQRKDKVMNVVEGTVRNQQTSYQNRKRSSHRSDRHSNSLSRTER